MGQIMAFDVLVQLHLDTVVGQSSWAQEEKATVRTQFPCCCSNGLKPSAKALPYSWRRGVVVSVVRRMNEVTLRRARLILGWVTVFGPVYHYGT